MAVCYCHRTNCETPTEVILLQSAIESEDTHQDDTVELMNYEKRRVCSHLQAYLL
ncbi:hypothetical protein L195_g037707, partial [Trifolium pratense]